jgi:AcrR family transcriptional regulator
VPRVGLDAVGVVAAGAALADEVGFPALTMGLLAEKVGVRTPSLYKHVANQDDLNRRIAALALVEAADAVIAADRGLQGRAALAAAAGAFREFVVRHPGRYAATIGVDDRGPDDPVTVASLRLLDAFTGVLATYGIPRAEMNHALRAVRSLFHGFATLQAAQGFQMDTDVDTSFEWLIDLVDRGLVAKV